MILHPFCYFLETSVADKQFSITPDLERTTPNLNLLSYTRYNKKMKVKIPLFPKSMSVQCGDFLSKV